MNPLGLLSGRVLVGSIFVALLGLFSVIGMPSSERPVKVTLTPLMGTVTLGETFTVILEVESETPVNAFSGQITFDDTSLQVESIKYNTSIADLWVEEPWYSAGAGTISFAGGTTRSGGFVGQGQLLSINFKAVGNGKHLVSLRNTRVFKHDGLGTEVDLDKPLDALFTTDILKEQAITLINTKEDRSVTVIPKDLTFDLNNDGEIGLADTSIFMINLYRYDYRFDFNQDEKVDLKDLNLLLSQ